MPIVCTVGLYHKIFVCSPFVVKDAIFHFLRTDATSCQIFQKLSVLKLNWYQSFVDPLYLVVQEHLLFVLNSYQKNPTFNFIGVLFYVRYKIITFLPTNENYSEQSGKNETQMIDPISVLESVFTVN